MISMNTTWSPPAATLTERELSIKCGAYAHQTMSRRAFRDYVANIYGSRSVRGLVFKAPYRHVEYLNASHGLIVLAHHDTMVGQVDGIHPSRLSEHVEHWCNIIEPLKGTNYAVHYMSRKYQGILVHAAFGRQIQAGDPEAPAFETDNTFTLEVFRDPVGNPLVAVIEGADTVRMIRSETLVVSEAA